MVAIFTVYPIYLLTAPVWMAEDGEPNAETVVPPPVYNLDPTRFGVRQPAHATASVRKRRRVIGGGANGSNVLRMVVFSGLAWFEV